MEVRKHAPAVRRVLEEWEDAAERGPTDADAEEIIDADPDGIGHGVAPAPRAAAGRRRTPRSASSPASACTDAEARPVRHGMARARGIALAGSSPYRRRPQDRSRRQAVRREVLRDLRAAGLPGADRLPDLRHVSDSGPDDLQGGDAAALVGGIAALTIVRAAFARDGRRSWRRSAEHIVDGLVFAFKAMGVVLPIAGFFFLGNGDFSGQIIGSCRTRTAPRPGRPSCTTWSCQGSPTCRRTVPHRLRHPDRRDDRRPRGLRVLRPAADRLARRIAGQAAGVEQPRRSPRSVRWATSGPVAARSSPGRSLIAVAGFARVLGGRARPALLPAGGRRPDRLHRSLAVVIFG